MIFAYISNLSPPILSLYIYIYPYLLLSIEKKIPQKRRENSNQVRIIEIGPALSLHLNPDLEQRQTYIIAMLKNERKKER